MLDNDWIAFHFTLINHPVYKQWSKIPFRRKNKADAVIVINILIEQMLFGFAFLFVFFNVCSKLKICGLPPGNKESQMLFTRMRTSL